MKQKCVNLVKRVGRQVGIDIRRAVPPEPPAPPILAANVLALTISDVLLRIVLAGGRSSDFTFVQIGANDGLSFDPIRRFVVKYGFRGVLVEPQPDVFARLQDNYAGVPGLSFENAAIAAEDGQMELYRFRKAPGLADWADCLASFSHETLVRNFHNVTGEVEAIPVPTLTFDSLVRKHGLDQVDLLQIDTEGFDYEIIKMIDFSKIQPVIIQFEHGFLSPQQQRECFHYLNTQGYKVTNNGPDTVAYIEPEEQSLFRIDVQADNATP